MRRRGSAIACHMSVEEALDQGQQDKLVQGLSMGAVK
jgi:hypothetical protein